jgi:hypothetical protein
LVVIFGSEGLGLRAPRLSWLRQLEGYWLGLGSERRDLIRVVSFQKKSTNQQRSEFSSKPSIPILEY